MATPGLAAVRAGRRGGFPSPPAAGPGGYGLDPGRPWAGMAGPGHRSTGRPLGVKRTGSAPPSRYSPSPGLFGRGLVLSDTQEDEGLPGSECLLGGRGRRGTPQEHPSGFGVLGVHGKSAPRRSPWGEALSSP